MKCKVCGKRFRLLKKDRYEILVPPTFSEVLVGSKDTISECFDCPKCGCQNIVNDRKGKTKPITAKSNASADELEQAFRQGYEQAKKE